MSRAETVRSGRLGKVELRLARKDGRYFGLADGKIVVEGEDADDVWRRLHDDAGKSNPTTGEQCQGLDCFDSELPGGGGGNSPGTGGVPDQSSLPVEFGGVTGADVRPMPTPTPTE